MVFEFLKSFQQNDNPYMTKIDKLANLTPAKSINEVSQSNDDKLLQDIINKWPKDFTDHIIQDRKEKQWLNAKEKWKVIQGTKSEIANIKLDITRKKLIEIYEKFKNEKVSKSDIRFLQSEVWSKVDWDFGPYTFLKLLNKKRDLYSLYIKGQLPSLKDIINWLRKWDDQKVDLVNASLTDLNIKQGKTWLDKKEEEKLSFFSKVSKKIDSLVDSFDIKTFNTKDVLAIIQFESFFNPNAKSKKKVENSSVWLMALTIHPINELKEFWKKIIIEWESLYDKVTEKVWKLEWKIKDIKESLFDTDTNLTVWTSYLKMLEEMWGWKKYPNKKYTEIANKSDKMKPRIKTLLKNKNMEMDDDVFSKVIYKLTSDKKTQEKYYLLSERYNTDRKIMKWEIMPHKFYYALLITYLSEYLEKKWNFDTTKIIA